GEAVAKLSPHVAARGDLIEKRGVRDGWTQLGLQVFVIKSDRCEAQLHWGGGAVDPRTISSFGSSTFGCGFALASTGATPSSMTLNSRSAACSPSCRIGCATVVSGGL